MANKKYLMELTASATVKFTKIIKAESEEEAKEIFKKAIISVDSGMLDPERLYPSVVEMPKEGHDFDDDEINIETEEES